MAPDLDEFSSRGVTVNLGGHDVRTFSPEDALLAICVHGSKDFWARLSWIADVSELIQSNPGLDWKAISARAEALQVQRMLHVGLILAARVLDATLPEEIAGQVKADPTRGRNCDGAGTEPPGFGRSHNGRMGTISASPEIGSRVLRGLALCLAPRDGPGRGGLADASAAARAGAALRPAAPAAFDSKIRALARSGLIDYFEIFTTWMECSMRTQRAGRLSCGATSRRGPSLSPRGLPSMVSATITSES